MNTDKLPSPQDSSALSSWPETDFPRIIEKQSPELRLSSEIQEDAYLQRSGTKVIESLCFVLRVQLRTCLSLYQDQLFDDQIGSKFPYSGSTKVDGYWALLIDRQASLKQRQPKRFHVHRFKETGPQFIVNIKEHPKDFFCDFGVFQSVFIRVYPWLSSYERKA